jgi:hypothetical protein
MNGILVAGLGFLLGLVYFGALWRSIHSLFVGRRVTAWLSLGWAGRFAIVAGIFTALIINGGSQAVLWGLGGMLMARGYLIHTIGRQEE